MNDSRWLQRWTQVPLLAALVLGAALGRCGGDEHTTDGPTATPSAEQSPAATSTPSPAVITASPTQLPTATPTPTGGSVGLLDEVAGRNVRVLEKLDPIGFPADLVLYFNLTCYGCEPQWSPRRAYRSASGETVIEPQVVPGTEPRRTGGPYIHAFAFGPSGYDAFAIVCTGFCGAISEPEPGSNAELWQSKDGAVTWQSLGPVSADKPSIAGVVDGRAVVGQITPIDGGTFTWTFYPGEEPVVPPQGLLDPHIYTTPGYGVAWIDVPQDENGPLRIHALSGSGITLTRPTDSRLRWDLMQVTPDGFFLWHGRSPSSKSPYSYIAFATPDGTVDRVYAWKGYDFRVLDGIDNRTFVGNALATDDDGESVLLPNGLQAFEPVVIDFEHETVAPISGLAPATNASNVGLWTFPYMALTGTFVRVEAGQSDCLNVREEPFIGARSLGCFASGVLLGVRLGLRPVEGWTPVSGPGNIEGWAASEFLSRAAGGAE